MCAHVRAHGLQAQAEKRKYTVGNDYTYQSKMFPIYRKSLRKKDSSATLQVQGPPDSLVAAAEFGARPPAPAPTVKWELCSPCALGLGPHHSEGVCIPTPVRASGTAGQCSEAGAGQGRAVSGKGRYGPSERGPPADRLPFHLSPMHPSSGWNFNQS